MEKYYTLQELYDDIRRYGKDYLKVLVELHDGDDTDYIVDVTVVNGDMELDIVYASADVDKDNLDDTLKQANEIAQYVFERLDRKYDNVRNSYWK